jgi:xylose isomerase
VYAHIGGMDAFARALIVADRVLSETSYKDLIGDRYASFDSGEGRKFEKGKLSLQDLAKIASQSGESMQKSGRQEYLENLINNCL